MTCMIDGMNAAALAQPEGLEGAIVRQVQAERARRGMTVEQLAEASGIPPRTLFRYLSGERSMPLKAVGLLAEGLGLTPDKLIIRAWAQRSEE